MNKKSPTRRVNSLSPTISQAPSIYYRPSKYLYNRHQQLKRESINTKAHHHTSAPRPHRRGMFFLGA
jgi:hypothetical protein